MTYEGRDLEVLADMPNYYGWIMSWFAPYVRGRVVEYGAGAGTVSKLLRPLADRLTLVEPSANLLPVLQARFPRDPGVEIGRAMLEEHSRQLPDGAMDTAVLVNVLEHIEDDEGALAELSRILAPGGHLLIFVPALPALMSKIDRIHGHFRRYLRPEPSDEAGSGGHRGRHLPLFRSAGRRPLVPDQQAPRQHQLQPHASQDLRRRRGAARAGRRGHRLPAPGQEFDSNCP